MNRMITKFLRLALLSWLAAGVCAAQSSRTCDVHTFATGTLYLKSNVPLRVDTGAAILGSPHIADYTTDTGRTICHGLFYGSMHLRLTTLPVITSEKSPASQPQIDP